MKNILLISLLLFIPLTTGASFDRNLYYGLQSDSKVKELQEFLTDQGFYSGPITGNFFSLTLKAVKQFQVQQALPQTGYFGILSRQKANNILTVVVAESNQEAINETGTTTPSSDPPKNANDIVKSLQEQIALLIQQMALLQSQANTLQQTQQQVQQQTQTIQQIQQNTQQIVQNTSCAPVWQCGSWSTCSNSTQTRICTDSNSCGVATNKPIVLQSCTVACSPNWQCGSWNYCTNNQQTRVCNDLNSCGVTTGKPTVMQSCTSLVGTLAVSVSADTPIDSNIAVGETQGASGISFSRFKLTAGTESVKISSLKFTRMGGRDENFKAIELYADSTLIKSGVLSGGTVTFNNLELIVGGSTTLTIKADLNGISAGYSQHGDAPKLYIANNQSDITSIGLSSGQDITEIDGTPNPETLSNLYAMHLYKTTATIAQSPIVSTGAKIASMAQDVLAVNITNNGDYDLAVTSFDVNTGNNYTSIATNPTKLYWTDDLTTEIASGPTITTGEEKIFLSPTSNNIVSAGTTRTLVVKADTRSTPTSRGTTLNVSLSGSDFGWTPDGGSEVTTFTKGITDRQVFMVTSIY